MTASKAAKAAPRERTSPQNGLPEPVLYVYRQQQRRNTYAARIARRNAERWGQLPPYAASAEEAPGVAISPLGPGGDLDGLKVLGAVLGTQQRALNGIAR